MSVSEELRTGSRASSVETAAAAFSAAAVAAAVWWWLFPGHYPLAEPDQMSLIAGPWSGTDSAVLALLGLSGLVTALGMRPPASPWRRLLAGATAVQVGALLGVAADARTLILLGYLLALAGPVLLLGLVAGRTDLVADVWRQAADGMLEKGDQILFTVAVFAGGLLWCVTLLRSVRRTRAACLSCGRPGAAWLSRESVARWGRWVTIAAAAGPLPYALVRMTWLTPWPYGMVDDMLRADPQIRLFGVSLGLAALGGGLLTLGLIRPWGEVFPGWLPVLRGRAVPVLLPTTIGLVVGTMITVAGRSFLQFVIQEPANWTALLIFPFPVWGPLLIAASVAYYLRRRGRCRVCGQG